MRKALGLLITAQFCSFAQVRADEGSPLAVVQKLFDAMSAHDASTAGTLFTPDAMLFSVHPDGTAMGMSYKKWVERLGSSQDAWLERIWNPKVLEHATIAAVWAEYDFHLNSKFSHCGIDSFSLLKTTGGWRIVSIADTHETSACSPSPLGPVQK